MRSPPRCSLARWQRLENEGARPTSALGEHGHKDPSVDVLYVKALAATFTVNTMPEATFPALADHGDSTASCPSTAATAKRCWPDSRARQGLDALAGMLQDRAKSFRESWTTAECTPRERGDSRRFERQQAERREGRQPPSAATARAQLERASRAGLGRAARRADDRGS